jgi:ParB/RepB/Spo0J family partition protein
MVRKEGEKYRVIIGHRRFLACKTAKYDPIPCYISEEEPERDIEKMLAENIARKDMSPVEEAAVFKEALDTAGHTPNSLAESIGRTREYVVTRLRILEFRPELQKALHTKQVNIAIAEHLSEIDDDEIFSRYLEDCIENHYAAKTVKNWVEIYKTSKDFRQKGFTDPRQAGSASKQSDIKHQCEVCGKYYPFYQLTSIIICKGCLALVNEFFEEYKKNAKLYSSKSACPPSIEQFKLGAQAK